MAAMLLSKTKVVHAAACACWIERERERELLSRRCFVGSTQSQPVLNNVVVAVVVVVMLLEHVYAVIDGLQFVFFSFHFFL